MSRFTRNRAKARREKAERIARIEAAYIKLENRTKEMIEYLEEDENAQFTCSLCSKWEPGDSWESCEFGIKALGRCKEGKILCWNFRNACKAHFEKKKRTGFFYQGGGGKSLAEDLENIMKLTDELIQDNL